jgi:hypothetical protein
MIAGPLLINSGEAMINQIESCVCTCSTGSMHVALWLVISQVADGPLDAVVVAGRRETRRGTISSRPVPKKARKKTEIFLLLLS